MSSKSTTALPEAVVVFTHASTENACGLVCWTAVEMKSEVPSRVRLPLTLPATWAPEAIEPCAVPWLALLVESLNCGAVTVGFCERCQTPLYSERQVPLTFCWSLAAALP